MGVGATIELRTDRLVLTTLAVDDASEMVSVLANAELYTFTGGAPPNLSTLTSRYRTQVAGSGIGDEQWHNWIVRLADTSEAVGFVQATVAAGHADVAWVVGVRWQGQGIAREAAGAMCQWLRAAGVVAFTAHIHPDHVASARVAAALGLEWTGEVDDESEHLWSAV